MSGFSYAQAARGQAPPSSQASATPASSTASAATQATPEKNADSSAASQNGSTTTLSHFNADSSKLFARTLNHDASASPLKVGSEAPSSPAASSTLAGTVTESTSNFSLDDATVHVASSDKPSRVSTPGTRSPATEEGARKGGRKGKASAKAAAEKDSDQAAQIEDAEKEKEPVKELVSAPPPAVNIWSQRMKEQAAKAKPNPPATKAAATTTSGAAPAASRSKDARKQASNSIGGDAASDTNGTPSSGNAKTQTKRANELTRVSGGDQPRRNAPRGARGAAEKDEKPAAAGRDALPLVRDAVSWPTPESAAVSDDTKTKLPLGDNKVDAATDKDAQDDAGSAKSRKKGWVPLPFVPSVNFQTPIPNVRGSKPKTGNRTSRDASSKSGGNSNNNSASGNASTTANGTEASSEKTPAEVPAIASNTKSDSEARNTAKENNGSALPARPSTHASNTHKRFSTDTSHNHPREPRKVSAANLPEKPKEAAADQSNAFVPKGNHHNAHAGAINGDANGQFHQPTHPAHADRRPPFSGKNNNTSQFNSSGKDFSSQEHKDQHGQHTRERTEPRGERSGRGGFRGGRGGSAPGAAGSTQNNQHIGHSTYQPNGQRVPPNNSYSSSTTVLPPTAAPFNPHPQQFPYGNGHNSVRMGSRNASRAQLSSQGSVSFGNRLQNGVGNNNNARLHGHPSHGVPNGPAEFQMQPYGFSSFSPYMDAELLHGLTVQVDYYFSLDNLVKDLFLRRKMNDQGFVPLSVIANFKRMMDLAPSIDFIRAACEQSENVDYVVDQEQNEWIRSRYQWSNFVVPREDREEEARKPGPDLRTVMFRSGQRPYQAYMHPMMNGGYPSMPQQPIFSPPAYPINGGEVLYQQHDNSMHADYASPVSGSGANGTELNGRLHRSGESQLSAAVPDFSPGGHGGAPTTLEDYQTCPDEQVEKLIVLVGSESEPAADSAEHSEANGSSVNGAQTDESQPAASRKIGEEPYPELRTRALEQRNKAKAGEVPATMKHLYRFWSHCLPDKFNVRMYEDFRTFALEDAHRSTPSDFGLKCLLQYYNRVLFTSANARPYPAVFLPHHNEAKQLSELQSSKAKVNGDSHA
ncbi:hypothetical protein SEUCBS139899_006697 [Sporothrix eucalyptigena]|uniref:HTH La-type RNA-binding domain-containing protein n=1 Tax=Sporothrix eucalyptigena TaxID=1812306 RepID=A0ABP0BA49_9PEZI